MTTYPVVNVVYEFRKKTQHFTKLSNLKHAIRVNHDPEDDTVLVVYRDEEDDSEHEAYGGIETRRGKLCVYDDDNGDTIGVIDERRGRMTFTAED